MLFRSAVLSGPGLELRFTTREAPGQTEAILVDVVGWYGGVGTEGDNSKRPLGHGLFVAPSTRTGRVLTLKGTLVHADEGTRAYADRVLSGALWDGELGTLTVNDGVLTLSAAVKLDGEIKLSALGTRAHTVEVPLIAPDPFLRGEDRTYQVFPAGYGEGIIYPLFAGGVIDWGDATAQTTAVIRNAGNAEAWPRVVVTGTFPQGFRITSGPNVVEYGAPTYPQSPVEIDMAGGVFVGGRDQSSNLRRRGFFSVPPGGSAQVRLTGVEPGSGWADVIVNDTFI